jgi:hypothetical protein
MEATYFLTENKRERDECKSVGMPRAGVGKGWRHALEPEVACVMGGDCRQPGGDSKRMECVLSKPCPQALISISLFLDQTKSA